MVVVQVRTELRAWSPMGEAVHRGQRGMDPVRMLSDAWLLALAAVHAGGVAPDAVQREQAHVRGAVTAPAAAAAGGRSSLQAASLLSCSRSNQVLPLLPHSAQYIVADETVVVVVAGIADDQPDRLMAAAAPLRVVVVPDVPHRLLGVGRPARALAGGDAAGAGGHGGGDVGDHRADLKAESPAPAFSARPRWRIRRR